MEYFFTWKSLNAKTVTLESAASEESIKQVIVTAGYAVKGY
ncbi:hypothetical protein [Nostoc sphaeroides]|uniref:Copper chaperone n=1 Tax=Nostoc sphaeroides CCNUC1 TaxID=2653204 RepID=A0A5P8VQZ3_9NOSO|nr:copper chaperone [Nostoc sphaeroides CCNUC1]